jgi:hypothetical protein
MAMTRKFALSLLLAAASVSLSGCDGLSLFGATLPTNSGTKTDNHSIESYVPYFKPNTSLKWLYSWKDSTRFAESRNLELEFKLGSVVESSNGIEATIDGEYDVGNGEFKAMEKSYSKLLKNANGVFYKSEDSAYVRIWDYSLTPKNNDVNFVDLVVSDSIEGIPDNMTSHVEVLTNQKITVSGKEYVDCVVSILNSKSLMNDADYRYYQNGKLSVALAPNIGIVSLEIDSWRSLAEGVTAPKFTENRTIKSLKLVSFEN